MCASAALAQSQLPPSIELKVLFDRSESILASGERRQDDDAGSSGAGRPVIFLFLRNVSARSSPAWHCTLDRRHLRAHVPAGFSLDNCRCWRSRFGGSSSTTPSSCGEYRAPHGDGETGTPGGARRLARDRLPDSLHDRVVGRGVHPLLFMPGILGRLFHELPSPSAPPFSSRCRVAHADADAVQPLPAAARPRPATAPVSAHRTRLRLCCTHGTNAACAGARAPCHDHDGVAADPGAPVGALRTHSESFIPNDDQGSIFAVTEAAQGVSFEAMSRHQMAAAIPSASTPAIKTLFASLFGTNASAGATSNQGRIFIHLQPHDTRGTPAEIIAELRPQLASIPACACSCRAAGDPHRRQLTKSQYQLTLQIPDTPSSTVPRARRRERLRAVPGLRDVTRTCKCRTPRSASSSNRDKASTLGVSAEQIESASTRRTATAGSRHLRADDQYKVILKLEDEYHARSVGAGAAVRARPQRPAHPAQCPDPPRRTSRSAHTSTSRTTAGGDVSFDVLPGVALSEAVDRVEAGGAPCAAGERDHQFSGNGAGVSVLARRPVAPADGGDHGHLHRCSASSTRASCIR